MTKLLVTTLATALLAFTAHAEQDFQLMAPQGDAAGAPVVFNKIYVPGGFDSQNNVQIVGEGLFRHSCYKHVKPSVRVVESEHKIYIGPVAYETTGMCIQMILPFQKIVDIGPLSAGKWEVVQEATNSTIGLVPVAATQKQTVDDYLYAPISQAFLKQKGEITEVLLTGEFPNSCMTLKNVKVTVEPDVLVIQPIAEINNGKDCKDGKFTFTKVVTIELVRAGRYLLHVRSMNGNAVNSLVDLK